MVYNSISNDATNHTLDLKWIESVSKNKNADLRLICCHHAGGNSSYFYPWLKLLPKNIELMAIQLPGHGQRLDEPLVTTMDGVVEGIWNDIIHILDKPYILFGHSMGALISYELTSQLQKHRLKLPEYLIASGSRAPHMPLRRAHIRNLPDQEFIEALKIYNGTPEGLFDSEPELLELFLPIIRADFTLLETYTYIETNPLNCTLIGLSGQTDPIVEAKETKGWCKHTEQEFKFYSLPGDHFFIKSSQTEILNILENIISSSLAAIGVPKFWRFVKVLCMIYSTV